MDDKEKFGIADTFVPYEELTNTLRMREKLLQLRREAEAREAEEQEAEERGAEEPESFEATTGIKVYPYVKTRVSLKQRVLSKLKKS